MKLSFATLGCPDWTIDEICQYGKEYGFDGVGIRGILGEFDLMKIKAFSKENRKETLKKFEDNNLEIVILSSSVKFNSPDKSERLKNLEQGKRVIDLASKMNINKIRVYGGNIPENVSKDTAHKWVIENFKRLGEYGGKKEVYSAIETHDDYTNTYVVKEIIEEVDNEYIKVLWDVHHPYRTCNETIKESWNNIGDHVIHTHFKDSYPDNEEELGYRYCLLGKGDVPNQEALQRLKDNGYKGYLSLEWEKAWHPYLPGPHKGFPQFTEKMNEYLNNLNN